MLVSGAMPSRATGARSVSRARTSIVVDAPGRTVNA
jgi:hypothetical protein